MNIVAAELQCSVVLVFGCLAYSCSRATDLDGTF